MKITEGSEKLETRKRRENKSKSKEKSRKDTQDSPAGRKTRMRKKRNSSKRIKRK